ncbi:MAG: ParA family protein [Clostridiales bacterium]|nr:ParA family protein [Clostridiales bacterium]
MDKSINIICGHYGSGKTNFSLNLALQKKREGKNVTVVDLDIVNPYFRTADYTDFLINNGIRVISPASAGTTVDAPQLTAEMYSVFDNVDGYTVIDVGGDDVGAYALGRFSGILKSLPEPYEMIFVINKFRTMIAEPEDALEIMNEIQAASRLSVTGIVNNSHLATITTAEDILSSLDYAEKTAKLAGLPLLATTAPSHIAPELEGKVKDLLPVDVIVKLPWN